MADPPRRGVRLTTGTMSHRAGNNRDDVTLGRLPARPRDPSGLVFHSCTRVRALVVRSWGAWPPAPDRRGCGPRIPGGRVRSAAGGTLVTRAPDGRAAEPRRCDIAVVRT